MQTSSFSQPINLVEEGEWLVEVTSFQTINSVFNITDEKNSFSLSTPGRWSPKDGGELINKLSKFLPL